LTRRVCVLLDLDDTLFAERDYFQSVFGTFASQLGLDSEIASTYLKDFVHVRTNIKDIFSHFLKSQDLYSKQNHDSLFEIYTNVETQLSPYDGVEALINELLQIHAEVAVLTNGVTEAQRNKWKSLRITSKERISFYAARDLSGDKPSPETYEAWRRLQKIEWSRVIAVGDKYENDIAYPLERGGSAVLVNSNLRLYSDSDRFRHVLSMASSAEHILSLAGRV
jgi:putative hydrolase of the HAD superfamily